MKRNCECCKKIIKGVVMGRRKYCRNCRSYIANIRAKIRLEYNEKMKGGCENV